MNSPHLIIEQQVRLLKKKYVEEYDIPAHAINQGECANFAEQLWDELKKAEINGEVLSDGFFFDPFEDAPAEEMDKPENWNSKTPNDFNRIGLPSHYWFYFEGKHYDSDCSKGVSDLFDLPLFKRFYQHYRKKENQKETNYRSKRIKAMTA